MRLYYLREFPYFHRWQQFPAEAPVAVPLGVKVRGRPWLCLVTIQMKKTDLQLPDIARPIASTNSSSMTPPSCLVW